MLTKNEGWIHLPLDWDRLIACEPGGCFVAQYHGQDAGTATVTGYEKRFGWVGMVLVRDDMRRKGIGTAMFDTRDQVSCFDVYGGEVCAALVSGLVAPQSPDEHRHETLWQYMQGGPGIFRGDLYFYRVDSDLRGKLGSINTALCPLYLFTGEYDFSCTPADALRTASTIPGAKVTIMREGGHFPMSENPAQFRKYLLPVFEEI